MSAMEMTPSPARGFEPFEPRLARVGAVDAVALEARSADLAKRSIKRSSKLQALDLIVRMIDLTTLEGADTPGKVAALCAKAMRPDPVDPTVPAVAAVCVYPNLVPHAKARLGEQRRARRLGRDRLSRPASTRWRVRVADVRAAVELGADEIDMVIDRGAFLAGRYGEVYDQIVEVREACGPAHLKVILETGELGSYDAVRRASLLAMAAGADFIKTSTGKISPAATLPVTLCMLEAIRDVHVDTGRMVGMKPAGGIRHSKQAMQYLCVLHETLGPQWMTPELFRFGASSLLNDVLMQIRTQKTGSTSPPTTSRSTDVGDVEHAPAGPRVGRTRPRPSRGRSSASRSATACSSAARWSSRPRASGSRRSRRPPRSRWPRSPRPARRTSTRRCGAPATASARGPSCGPAERAKYLFRIARILQERSRELAVAESLDGGKPIKESRDVDLPLAAAHFFYHAGWADKLEYAFANRQPRPLGVAAQIIPWNFPLLMLAWKVAPALACGNTVVLKPAETTPLTALIFADVCRQAELPAGAVNIITGDGSTGAELVQAHRDRQGRLHRLDRGREGDPARARRAAASRTRSSWAARPPTSCSTTARSTRRSRAS